MPIPYDARGAPRGDARADRPQRPALLLHPPDRLPRLRADGPVPARGAGRRRDRRVGVGRLPRRGGQADRHPRQGLLVAAHQPRLADPARQGRRASTSTACWRRSRATRPATRRRSCSTTTATSARARARTSSSCATASIFTPPQTASDPRRHQPQVGHPDRARPRLRGRRARHRARRALPGRRGLHDAARRPSSCPVREVDDHAIGDGRPGAVTRAVQQRLRGRPARPRRALPRLARRRPGTLEDGMSRRFSCSRIPGRLAASEPPAGIRTPSTKGPP